MTIDFRAGPALAAPDYSALMHRAVFDCCKWNLSAGDAPALCRYPILIEAKAFAYLSRKAEALAAESLAAEKELLQRPELHARLGLPPRTARLFRANHFSSELRFLRVDFHPTPNGYRITEANSDVAGGFIEGSGISTLWAQRHGGRAAGDPAGALAEAFVKRFGVNARVGFLHLTRYIDDRQVVTYLSRRFKAAGLECFLFDASQLRADLSVSTSAGPVTLDALFRFFPGEWLEQLPANTHWKDLARSPFICNPLTTMLTQTKRFPIAWSELRTPLKTWRALLPETVSPEGIDLPSVDWVIKPALGHEGFGISISGVTAAEQDRAALLSARRSPQKWAAQRRFQFTPIDTPDGPRFACVGIYVVAGRAAGAYARVGKIPFINDSVQDAIVLLEDR